MSNIHRKDLKEKALCIQNIVENRLYSPNGLFYSFLNIENMKPIGPELASFYPVKQFSGKPNNVSWLENENSGMASGSYLSALCCRARVEPGAQVEAMISRVFASIEKTYQLCAVEGNEGFLCKPWGGKATNETSIDQCSAVIIGLRELFWLKYHEYSQKAGELALAICDWWMRNDYTIEYWGTKGKVIENSPWSFSCLTLIRIAHEISRKDIYSQEEQKIIAAYNCEDLHPRSLGIIHNHFPGKPHLAIRKFGAFHHTLIDNLGVSCEIVPEKSDRWHKLLQQFWEKEINMGIDEDGLAYTSYCFDKRDNSWEPIKPGFIYPSGVPPEKCEPRHHYWFGGMKSGIISCMTASSAATIGRYVEGLRDECAEVASKILKGIDLEDMTMIIDKDGDQECKEFGGIREKMFDCRCCGHWLRAYWTGRELGWF